MAVLPRAIQTGVDILRVRLKRWQWVAAAIGLTALLMLWALLRAAHFLESPAMRPRPAELMVVLGGDAGDRALTAKRLHAARMAPRVLLTGVDTTPSELRQPLMHWRAHFLVNAGVPREQLLFDSVSGNSWEEAVNTRRLMEARGWRTVLVVSDPYHMRRLSWIWRRVFDGSAIEVTLVASAPEFWKPGVWWRDERSAQAVIMETVKLGYYLVKY